MTPIAYIRHRALFAALVCALFATVAFTATPIRDLVVSGNSTISGNLTALANSTTTFPANSTVTFTNATLNLPSDVSRLGSTINLTSEVDSILPLANGGTGSANATAARTALGLAIGTDVQAWDADLADLADGTLTGNKVSAFTGDSGSGGDLGAVPAPAAGDGSAGKYLRADGSWAVPIGSNVTWNGTLYAILADVKTSGTNGGNFTSGAWQTRTLNTEVHDPGGIVTLNTTTSNFTLGNGTYRISASAPALFVSSHQARLFNITGNSVVAYGTSEYSNTVDHQTRSFVEGVITISTGPTELRLEHRCFTTRNSTGFGANVGFGGDEVYSVVRISKEQ